MQELMSADFFWRLSQEDDLEINILPAGPNDHFQGSFFQTSVQGTVIDLKRKGNALVEHADGDFGSPQANSIFAREVPELAACDTHLSAPFDYVESLLESWTNERFLVDSDSIDGGVQEPLCIKVTAESEKPPAVTEAISLDSTKKQTQDEAMDSSRLHRSSLERFRRELQKQASQKKANTEPDVIVRSSIMNCKEDEPSIDSGSFECDQYFTGLSGGIRNNSRPRSNDLQSPRSEIGPGADDKKARNRAASLRFRQKDKARRAGLEKQLKAALEKQNVLRRQIEVLRLKNQRMHQVLMGDAEIAELQCLAEMTAGRTSVSV